MTDRPVVPFAAGACRFVMSLAELRRVVLLLGLAGTQHVDFFDTAYLSAFTSKRLS